MSRESWVPSSQSAMSCSGQPTSQGPTTTNRLRHLPRGAFARQQLVLPHLFQPIGRLSSFTSPQAINIAHTVHTAPQNTHKHLPLLHQRNIPIMDLDGEADGYATLDITDSDEDLAVIDRADVSNYNPEHILPESPAVVQQIRKWLAPTPYLHEGGEYRRHLASHAKGTGHWLTATETYRKWHTGSDDGLLWIRGIPGSGKSVFAAMLADVLAREGHPVLFFFFRQIIDANHEPVNMLRDWLDQVLEYSPPLQRDLKVYIDEKRRDLNRQLESVGTDQLWEHLKTALAHLPRVYLVADALDEMGRGNDECLKALARLGLWRPGQVKVLLTSRPVNTVEAPLREFPMLRIRLEERLVDTDIATYVQHSLASSAIPAEDRALIEAAVPGRANGLFLYAKLAMDAFLEPDAEIRRVLGKLPADLNAMYSNLLAEHARTSGVSEDTQRLLLCWVTHATRPLRLLEMAEMLKITHYGRTSSADTEVLKKAKALVRAACGPLLEIHPDETVSVVHHSLTEFLLGSTRSAADETDVGSSSFPILMPGPANEQLALSCLHYLQSSGCLDMSGLAEVSRTKVEGPTRFPSLLPSITPQRRRAFRLEFPFADYASNNWAIHAAKSLCDDSGPPSTTLISALDGFLVPGHRLEAWLGVAWRPFAEEDVTASHIAARYGLTRYLEHLLRRDGATTATCVTSKLQTPLFYAAESGHAATVQLLIANGADLNPEDHVGHKPLHLAAQNNHAGVVEVLLAAGVDPLTTQSRKDHTVWRSWSQYGEWWGPGGPTALMYACRAGHVAVIGAFLPWLHDVSVVQQALDCASQAGQPKVVKRLISHPGVDVNAMVYGHTALFNACDASDVESMEALLLAGADATLLCPGGDGQFGKRRESPVSPLEIFCSSRRQRDDGPVLGGGGLERGLDLLLGAGADLHRRDLHLQTPLHRAAGRLALFRLLLRAGADPNAESANGGTLLHMDLGYGDDAWELVELLVREGKADINKRQRSNGQTPVIAMVRGGNIGACLRFINEFGPDCTIADDDGDTALHKAAWLSKSPERNELIDALLAAGAQVNQRNRAGETALHVAHVSAVEHLVSRGADLEARDYEGATPLMRNLREREAGRKYIDILLKLGARLDTTDFAGRTLVHEMASSLSNRDAEYSLEDLKRVLGLLGADASQVDHRGNTALHELAIKQDGLRCDTDEAVALLEYLVQRGVDPDAVNHEGQTVLHRLGGGRASHPLLVDAAIAACSKETLDLEDHRGWRPIHHAVSTANKNAVARLMGAGADMSAPTHDGRTLLHLAGDCNVLGMILTELTTAARYRDVAPALVDAEDQDGCTPLFYACRSGQPASVALLLDAGAEVKRSSGLLLTACSMFERADRQKMHMASGNEAKRRRKGEWVEEQIFYKICLGAGQTLAHFHTRLDEILALLVDHGLDPSSGTDDRGRTHLQAALDAVSDSDLDHTVRCLSKLAPEAKRDRVPPLDGFESFIRRWAEMRREAATQAFHEAYFGSPATGDRNLQERLLVRLLERREFDLVEAAVKTGVCDPSVPSEGGLNVLHVLVALGNASLLARIATPEGVRRLDDVPWLVKEEEERTKLSREWWGQMDPLVLAACKRAAPNMLVLRLLVDEMKASVNAGFLENSGPRAHLDGDSPLHVLAMGNHWWQAYQALPYLLSRQPDLEARDRDGHTPLHRTLDTEDCDRDIGLFRKHAVKLLAAAGADVNAVTRDGRTCLCLAAAGGHVELMQLLIEHGARVTVPVVLAAIENCHARGLEALLSAHETPTPGEGGVSPSPPRQLPEFLRRDGAAILYFAATVADGRDYAGPFEAKREAGVEMVKLLLAHGADPFGTFLATELVDPIARRRARQVELHDDKELPITALHHILLSNGAIEPFLQLPDLNLEHRNSTGQTLLLAACAGPHTLHRTVTLPGIPPQSLITHLLDRGADPSATDSQARNALHTALSAATNHPGHTSHRPATNPANLTTLLQTLLTHSPNLLNTPDKSGSTPLHHALASTPYLITATRTTPSERITAANTLLDTLLNAGADAGYVNPLTGDTALHLLGRTLVRDRRVGAALFRRFGLELGGDVNVRNGRGETAVFGVVGEGRGGEERVWCWDSIEEEESGEGEEEGVWRVLREVGVDFGVRDCEGRGLLHVVAEREDGAKVFRRLVRVCGLDPGGVDGRLRTSLDVAAACGNWRVLEMFGREEGGEEDGESDFESEAGRAGRGFGADDSD